MLESIRNKSKGPVAKFVIGLIIIPFAFTGVYSYFNSGSQNVAAVVNDSEITVQEFERAYRTQQQQWGENFDRFFNTDERLQQFRMNVLQQLINQRLSSQAISEMGLRGSDEAIRAQIMSMPDFQDENGNFNLERYQLLVQSAGFSPEQYQQALKADIASNQFFEGLSASNFSLDYELLRHQSLESQTRDIDYVVIEKAAFSEVYDFTTDEAQIELREYYDMNQGRFSIPEKVALSYILINKSDFMDNEISDEEVALYYSENQAQFSGTDRRKVAHILINLAQDADEATVASAQTKIAEAQKAIADGEAFELVVAQYSEDTVSADMGGEFGWVEDGLDFDDAFEAAAMALTEVGAVSEVVQSRFGFHILKLLETESSATKPLEEVSSEIVEFLQDDLAQDRFFEARELLAERAFEYSDSLEEAATATGINVKTTALFDRQFGIGMPPELQASPEVLQAAFSDEILLDEVNSEVIDLGADSALVIRKSDYQAEGIRDFSEVTAEIEGLLTEQRNIDKTAAAASQVMESLKAGEALEIINSSMVEQGVTLSWQTQAALSRTGTEVDSRIREQAFEMNLETDAVTQVGMTSGDYAIIKLSAINTPEANLLTAQTHQEKFLNFYRQSELSAYLKHLEAGAEIQRRASNTEIIQ